VAARRLPDVILLDLMLPDRSGLTVLQALKADGASTRHIPVLVVSISEEGIHALSLGAAEWLHKPVDGDALAATVHRLLGASPPGAATALLVDDDEKTIGQVGDRLRAEGFQVVTARSSGQAIESIRHAPPDLLLVDLMRPDLSGFEVLDVLREAPANASVPVIVLAAPVEDDEAPPSVSLPGRRRLSKTVDLRALVTEVHRQASRHSLESREDRV
jgi:DNA-binding response OmpR family regulator